LKAACAPSAQVDLPIDEATRQPPASGGQTGQYLSYRKEHIAN
jgi:hypothetical protein